MIVSADLRMPFENLPWGWQTLFYIALGIIGLVFIWSAVLLIRSVRYARDEYSDPDSVSDFLWVFLVPALNEERVIRDSVDRLARVNAENKRVIVIDDGSDDQTAAILHDLKSEHRGMLSVLTRRSPDAREGKAAALNHAYGAVNELAAESGFEPDQVIVGIIDADGRLDEDAPERIAAHFAEPEVGGVQAQVRIYNRRSLLGWFQDVEFGVYGRLFQAGRSRWGSAGMGGNGQFNRLSALSDIADHRGPWRDRLTEDQDLGLRLIAAGWRGRHELEASVSQQGLRRLGPLYRQRTRWSQGNLQAMGLAPAIARSKNLSLLARADLLFYSVMPILQAVVGAALFGAIFLWITGVAPFWSTDRIAQLVFFYLLGFGSVIFGCIARGTSWGVPGVLRGLLIAQAYAFYSWILWPVLIRSAARQLTAQTGWVKTKRERV